jgi:hypothetical protein
MERRDKERRDKGRWGQGEMGTRRNGDSDWMISSATNNSKILNPCTIYRSSPLGEE